MQNSLLRTLRSLKKAFHDGEISSVEYAKRRQDILDNFVPTEEEDSVAPDNDTMVDLIGPGSGSTEPMEESNTVTVLLDADIFDEDDNTGAHFLGKETES